MIDYPLRGGGMRQWPAGRRNLPCRPAHRADARRRTARA
nr:MAG TPA: hypothetical protein [Caudoviricetes sp.]